MHKQRMLYLRGKKKAMGFLKAYMPPLSDIADYDEAFFHYSG